MSTSQSIKEDALMKLAGSIEREKNLSKDIYDLKSELKDQERKTKEAEDQGNTLMKEKIDLSQICANKEKEAKEFEKKIQEGKTALMKEVEKSKQLGAELATKRSKIIELEGAIKKSAKEAHDKSKQASELEGKVCSC